MVSRIWHGYTTFENSNAYENLLKTTIFPFIENKKIGGFRKIELNKRELSGEVEFITIMWFDTLDDVKLFAGNDYETAVVPPQAKALLNNFDEKAQHYNVIESRIY